MVVRMVRLRVKINFSEHGFAHQIEEQKHNYVVVSY